MKKALLAGSLAILALGAAASAHAAWPERPITIVVPFSLKGRPIWSPGCWPSS